MNIRAISTIGFGVLATLLLVLVLGQVVQAHVEPTPLSRVQIGGSLHLLEVLG